MNNIDRDSLPEASFAPRRRLSSVWLLPLVAAAIALWLLYHNMADSGLAVTVHFTDGSGITAGKTPVVYQGITVGQVESLHLNNDLDGATATLALDIQIEPLIRKNTEFWLVKPQVSLSGVSGLDTLVAGNYISFKPGDGKAASEFRARTDPPPFADNSPGLRLLLDAPQLGSISIGAPVLYQQIDVGEVEGYQLNDQGVEISLRIDPRYQHLVNQQSRFWNHSGVSVNAGLQGVKVETGSLASVLAGGIAFDSPKQGAEVESGHRFTLHDSKEMAQGGKTVAIRFRSAEGLSVGAKLRLQGLVIGRVDAVEFSDNDPHQGADATVRIRAPYYRYLNADTDFWLVTPQVSTQGIQGLDTLLGGPYISARLNGEPGALASRYTALSAIPDPRIDAPGLRLTLRSDQLHSVDVGSKVFYRKIAVGQVESVSLDASGVDLGIFIHQRYEHLVHRESRFWNASGFAISGGLGGLELQADSLATIVSGGIAFHTPEVQKPQAAWEGLRFKLHPDYDSTFADKGREISLRFSTGSGISKSTEIKYQGIKVGEVTGIELNRAMDGVNVSARLAPSAKALARKGSQFWLVSPQLGLVGTRNLETLVTGSYISVLPGDGEPHSEFIALDRPPRLAKPGRGLNLVLTAPRRGSIKEGVRVFYRDIPVGQVFGVELSSDAKQTLVHINIEPRYSKLVHRGSRFWNSSGVSVNFGLFTGTTIRSKAVESLLEGGIAFATPEGEDMGPPAQSGEHFALHSDVKSDWLDWSPAINVDRQL